MRPDEKLKLVLILLLVFTVFPLPVSFKKATCIRRGGAGGPVGYECLDLRKNAFKPRYRYFRFGLQLKG